jgi:hypothetical protein
MAGDNYPQAPKIQPPKELEINRGTVPQPEQTQPAQSAAFGTFPPATSLARLHTYDYTERLFMGDHFNAFNIKINDGEYNRAYSRLRYVQVNFAGIVSKVIADMLFGEPVTIRAEDGDQEFIDSLVHENKLDVQFYESALSNSYLGDAVFKLRVGPRNPNEKSTVIIEDITPRIYFPEIDGFNVRAKPKEEVLAWTFTLGTKMYLRKEIHERGTIRNELWEMEGDKIITPAPLSILDANMPQIQATGINQSLIVHVPNWKTGNRTFGISDYTDLDNLFYALNNRMTKVDNVLDKHTDPILMVPPGILDEKGNVKKKSLGVIEIGEGETGKPEYIVWDASLENAFKEIEKLVEFMYLVGEISPDVLGLGEGISDSGRALKFKLMRTIAKVTRKKLYYDHAIKQVMYVAQLLAKQWGLEAAPGVPLKGEPVVPEIEWADGLPVDISEQIENETAAIDAGITSKRDAIMRVYQVDEDTAEAKVKEINEETRIAMPEMDLKTVGEGLKKKKDEPPATKE